VALERGLGPGNYVSPGWERALGTCGARAGPGAELPSPAAPSLGLRVAVGVSRAASGRAPPPTARVASVPGPPPGRGPRATSCAPPALGGEWGKGRCGRPRTPGGAGVSVAASRSTSAVFTERPRGAHVWREGPGVAAARGAWADGGGEQARYCPFAFGLAGGGDRTLQMTDVGRRGGPVPWTLGFRPRSGVRFRWHVGAQGISPS
jgi:hypothetical protein